MKRRLSSSAALVALLTAATPALAESDGTHLEIAGAVTPTFVQDPAYEAFSGADLRAERAGVDVRAQVAELGTIALVPFLSYRGAGDDGDPYGVLKTHLGAHDFTAGLRLRAWFRPWLGAFVQAEGGLTYARVHGRLYDSDSAREEYSDDATTWCAGGLLGIELRLPPSLFEKQEIDWLDFGIEVGGGYLRRGEIDVSPALGGGDANSLPVADTADLGGLNLSGWTVQVALTVSLF
jgi:hypothetical protein